MKSQDLLPPLGIRAWTFVLNRLPRPCRTGAITTFCCNELRVFQSLTEYTTERLNESALIVVLTLVESECLLIAIPKQMKRLDVYISAFKCAFQKRPEIFQSVSMDLSACVAFQVVNYLAVIILLKIVVGHKRIRADGRARFHMLANIAAKLRAAGIRNYLQYNTRELVSLPAFKDALNRCFFDSGITNTRAAILMHVTGLSTDVGFVRLTSP